MLMDICTHLYTGGHKCTGKVLVEGVYTGIRTPEAGHAVTPLFGATWGDSRGSGAETHTMPTDLDDYETGGTELLFSGDLEGTRFSLRGMAVYEAEEVRTEVGGDVPKFGNWLPIKTENGDGWAVALGELVDEIKRIENPIAVELEVTRCEKSGSKQTDSYEVNTEVVSGDGQQTGL